MNGQIVSQLAANLAPDGAQGIDVGGSFDLPDITPK
jgi:hypothetical protein